MSDEPNAVTVIPAQAITPMAMIQMAVQQGADIDKLRQLMDLQERWEKNEARKAFVAALNAFKANPPELSKNKHVMFETQKGRTEYDHATLDNVSLNIGRALSQHGLSHRWDVEQKEGGIIRVTCVLTHCQGHSERVPMEGMPDISGGKNSIQGIGSTVTYLQRYTLLAATGKDQDDDGEGGEKAKKEPARVSEQIWKKLSDQQRNRLADLSLMMKEYMQMGDMAAAVKAYEDFDMDADEHTGFWSLFDSKERAAIKKYRHDQKREAQISALKQGAVA
jgi:hypothetical protein